MRYPVWCERPEDKYYNPMPENVQLYPAWKLPEEYGKVLVSFIFVHSNLDPTSDVHHHIHYLTLVTTIVNITNSNQLKRRKKIK